MKKNKKVVITSDSHENGEAIQDVVKFAQENGIDTALDCGDLHGAINSFDGLKLHAVYWGEACGAMERYSFENGVSSIGGTVHENGSTYEIDGAQVFVQHNLADYEKILPEGAFEDAKSRLEDIARNGEAKLALFGHTHSFYFDNKDGVTVINPGGLGENEAFVVFDPETGDLEYRGLDGRLLLEIDGQDPEYTQVRNFYVNGQGPRFVARLKSGKEALVVEGKPHMEHNAIKEIVAADKNNPIYVAVQENDAQVVVDGERVGNQYEEVKTVFKSGGYEETPTLEAYVAKKGEKEILVAADSRESAEFDKIKDTKPYISDDKIIFVAKRHLDKEDCEVRNSVDMLIVNDEIKASYKSIDKIVCDGENIAANVELDDGREAVVFNDEQGKAYGAIKGYSGAEILDGKPAYVAKEGEEQFVVFGEEECRRYQSKTYSDRIDSLGFVGGNLVYKVEQKTDEGEKNIIVHGEDEIAVLDKKEDGSVARVGGLGDDVAYVVHKDNHAKLICNGEVMLEDEFIHSFRKAVDGTIVYKRHEGDNFAIADEAEIKLRDLDKALELYEAI